MSKKKKPSNFPSQYPKGVTSVGFKKPKVLLPFTITGTSTWSWNNGTVSYTNSATTIAHNHMGLIRSGYASALGNNKTHRSLAANISCRRNYNQKYTVDLIIRKLKNLESWAVVQDNEKFYIYSKQEREDLDKIKNLMQEFRDKVKFRREEAYLEADPESKYQFTPRVKVPKIKVPVYVTPLCTGLPGCKCVPF